MTSQCHILSESSPEQLLANVRLLLHRNIEPVLGDKRASLYSSKLSQVRVIVRSRQLNEEDERFKIDVELLLQDPGRFLNAPVGCWKRDSQS